MTSIQRKSKYPILTNILNRYSARKFSTESVSITELEIIFEAARWAPSAMNNQLWHFAYARKNTQHWDTFFNLLLEGNQTWCQKASTLAILLSRKYAYYKDKIQPSHTLEAGMAFENLAIQANSMNIVAHPMAGFDYQKTQKILGLNNNWKVECMIAIGKEAKDNSEEKTKRKNLEEIITEGIPELN